MMNEDKIAKDKLEKDSDNKSKRKTHYFQTWLFFITLFALFVVGLYLPKRPSKSELEKRNLTEFPKFTINSFIEGEYFNQLSTWYADTFPFRDTLISMNTHLKQFYGVMDTQLVANTTQQADDIPDDIPEVVEKDDDDTNPKDDDKKSLEEKAREEEAKKLAAEKAEEERLEAEKALEETPEDGTIFDKPEAVGNVLITGDRAFSVYYFSKNSANLYSALIDKIQKKLPDRKVYDILVPTASGVMLDDKAQEGIGSSNQKKAIEYVGSKIKAANKKVVFVNPFENLKKHNAEYIYFRTDHHWTQLGAYYAYEEFCKAKGIEPVKLEDKEKKVFDGFIGTHYSASKQSPALKKNPDQVETYSSKDVKNMRYFDGRKMLDWKLIMDVKGWNTGTYYSAFAGGDQIYAEIDNPIINDGSSAVFIKESYGNAFAPYLADHYDKVYIIDYRYFNKYKKYNNNLTKFIEDKNVQDIIILNNLEALTKLRIQQMNSMFLK